jgi:hypothetical protein
MFPPGLGDLFFKATFVAEQWRASEISVDILLAALDAPDLDPASVFRGSAGSESGGYYVNTDWKSLSTDAAKALTPFAEMETLDRDALRRALLDAKQQ